MIRIIYESPEPAADASPSALRLDRWYDRKNRTWVVQAKDSAGNQVGDAIYVATKREAMNCSLVDFKGRL